MIKDKEYEAILWERIKEQIPLISKREARFRHIDKLPALGAIMKYYEQDCSDCLLYRKEIEHVIANLPKVLKYKSKELEDEMSRWTKHLQEAHQVYPDYYFNYRYSTFGFFGGVLIGVIFSWIFYGAISLVPVSIPTMILMVVGYVYGLNLDMKVKKRGKNY